MVGSPDCVASRALVARWNLDDQMWCVFGRPEGKPHDQAARIPHVSSVFSMTIGGIHMTSRSLRDKGDIPMTTTSNACPVCGQVVYPHVCWTR